MADEDAMQKAADRARAAQDSGDAEGALDAVKDYLAAARRDAPPPPPPK